MSKYKAGLHKEVSAIFNGVSLPKSNGSQQSSATPAPAHQDYSAPKPPAPEPPTQKPPVPSHMTPTKPKPEPSASPRGEQLPLQSPPKAAPAKQPKADTAIKAAGRQIPWQRTLEQIKSKLFATKPGVSTTKQKMMVILAPVLFIVLIFVFIQAFSTPSRKITGPGTSGPVKAAAASDSKVDWQVPNPYPTTLRDPMQFGPVTTQTGQADTAGLIVKGIVYSKNNPCAVIGDQIVHQGDKVLGVVIIKINENNVEFEVNSKKWTQKVQR
jgi:outer membrane biosynthesis protein TonB